MFNQPNRREFLQASAIIAGSLVLPKTLLATEPDNFFFIRTDTNDSWSVPDPVQWSLDNVHNPTLERTREGLLKLTSDDGDRIIRLVVRRCRLNLIEIQHEQVSIHHWGPHTADFRSFFKTYGLARQDISVLVRNRKTETTDSKRGDEFLFGERQDSDFPFDLFKTKWVNRFNTESDDWSEAPFSHSGYSWEGVENNRIPWSAMKSAWRKSFPMICLNCDTPTLLTNFGNPWTSMFCRTPRFNHDCGECQRSFSDYSIKDARDWMAVNLDEVVLPNYDMVWDRRVSFSKHG